MRRAALFALALVTTAAPMVAQSPLASRVAEVSDGIVRMQFDSRPGVCGDGHDRISFRHSTFGNNYESYGRWSDGNCLAGPLRVTLTVAAGRVTRVETQVGGTWRTGERAVDLGSISPREASAYLFSLVPQLESARDRNRVLLPAVLADDVVVIPSLLALARGDERTLDTKRDAVHWIGVFGDASVVPVLVSLTKDHGDDDHYENGLGGVALSALATLEGGAGVPALIDLARHGAAGTRRTAVFWLGQNGDPRALQALRSVIADRDETVDVRKNAIFSFGQSQDAPTKDLVALYRDLSERQLREQTIFALSQRHDAEATKALLAIARDDADKSMRGKALFWLAQTHDPAATKLISDLILK
jgi:hypothetical protein